MKPAATLNSILLCLILSSQVIAQSEIDFSRDIQPILSENCYFCHGPDPQERKADLRLDVEESARDWFEPGSPEDSDLYLRISTDDPLDLMPPANSHRKLTPKQIDLIRRWIEQGGKWGQHWSLKPIDKPNFKTHTHGTQSILSSRKSLPRTS